MFIKKRYYSLILTGVILYAGNTRADSIDEEDLSRLKTYNYLVRSKRMTEVKQLLGAKKEPTYIESYMMAMILENEKNHKAATPRFANAAFKYKPIPEGFSPAIIIPYMESGIRRSPLYPECIYEISRIYLFLYSAESASKMLALLPADIDPVLKSKVTELRVEIISRLNAGMAIEIYHGILREHQSPMLYLKLGGLYYVTGKYDEAFENYFRVLDFPENDWTYQKSVRQLDLLLKKAPSFQAKLTEYKKVQMAEGYRINKNPANSQNLWQKINPSLLDTDGLVLYIQNFCRFNITLRQYNTCYNTVMNNISRVNLQGQEKLYNDLGTRLFNAAQYELVTALIPETDFPSPSLVRLRSLAKMMDSESSPERRAALYLQARKEAKKYLNRFDNDSQYAEGVFFKVCFQFLEKKDTVEASACLQELADATTHVSVGGRSRYFIARLLEKNGDSQKANEMYKQVYLNSPAHFYAFTALRKITTEAAEEGLIPSKPSSEGSDSDGMSPEYLTIVQQWIARNFNSKISMSQYFLEKKKRPGFGVDRFWVDFERKLRKTVNSMTLMEKKAALFAGMGYESQANPYLDEMKKSTGSIEDHSERKFMILLYAGLVTDDAYLKSAYIQLLLTLYDKQPDVMTLSPLVADCLYPTPYRNMVTAASEKYQIESARVYALMKQESGFHPGATSRSGARGLMQIMPATAKWLNKSLKIRNLNLYDPSQSIELGGFFYSWLNKVSDGRFENMAIAYNAGPGRLKEWINLYYHEDLEIFIEKIPTDETYSYVQKTRNYYDRYKILFDNDYPSTVSF